MEKTVLLAFFIGFFILIFIIQVYGTTTTLPKLYEDKNILITDLNILGSVNNTNLNTYNSEIILLNNTTTTYINSSYPQNFSLSNWLVPGLGIRTPRIQSDGTDQILISSGTTGALKFSFVNLGVSNGEFKGGSNGTADLGDPGSYFRNLYVGTIFAGSCGNNQVLNSSGSIVCVTLPASSGGGGGGFNPFTNNSESIYPNESAPQLVNMSDFTATNGNISNTFTDSLNVWNAAFDELNLNNITLASSSCIYQTSAGVFSVTAKCWGWANFTNFNATSYYGHNLTITNLLARIGNLIATAGFRPLVNNTYDVGTNALLYGTGIFVNVSGLLVYQRGQQVVDTISGKNLSFTKTLGSYNISLSPPNSTMLGGILNTTCTGTTKVRGYNNSGEPICGTDATGASGSAVASLNDTVYVDMTGVPQIKTNVGTADVVIYSDAGEFGFNQTLNFTNWRQFRIFHWIDQIGTGTINISFYNRTQLFYSTTFTASGMYDSGWVNMPNNFNLSGANNSIGPVIRSTTGTDDPVFNGWKLWVRQ